jgi:uncharacterized protein YjeT (DUF2065 family)
MCIAAGVYTLLRGKLPPLFRSAAGFTILEMPPSAVRRWGLGLLLFGVVLGILAWLGLWMRRAA